MNRLFGGVILAGGKGERLLPLTAKTPKPMLPLGKKTPISMAIDALSVAGIEKIAVTTGYLAEEIENAIFDTKSKITYFREEFPMGTAGMTLKILPLLEDNFFVVSADCIFDFNLSHMMSFHLEREADITIATVSSDDPTSYGTIVCEKGKIISFREKPSWKQTISTKINAGIYIIKRSVLEKIEKTRSDFASDIFPFLLHEGFNLFAFDSAEYWCDMGTLQSYYHCNMFFSGGENIMGDYVSISKSSEISESLIMNGVRVGDNTRITNSVIGEGVSIGKNCVIENAVIGPDSLICDEVTIKKESIISENSILNKGAVFNKPNPRPPVFCDSGKVSLEEKNCEIFGKALYKVSGNAPLYIFHSVGCDEISKKIFKGCKEIGCKASPPCLSTYPLSAFVASEKNCYSVFVDFAPPESFFAFVFDKNGLLLSREEQLLIEKYADSPIKLSSDSVLISENINPFSIYTKNKLSLFENMAGEKANLLSDNLSSDLCKEILTALGVEVMQKKSYDDQTEEQFANDNISHGFRINGSGNDVEYVDDKGHIIDKFKLFSIASTYFPPNNIPLPDYIPTAIKNAIASKGSFSLYGDSILNRKKDNGPYSFFDGVSIVIAVVYSCFITKKKIGELNALLPPFSFMEKNMTISEEKGRVIDALFANSNQNMASGIGFFEDENHIHIIPGYGKSFKIFAEALSAETAKELISKAEKNISLAKGEKRC